MTEPNRGELQEVLGYIQTARHALEAGGEIDLKPLETKIERFCSSLEELPPEQRKSMKKKAIALIDDLDHLAEDLRSQYSALSEQLSKMSNHHRALSAYGKQPSDKE